MLGLKRGTLKLVPYCEAWKRGYHEEKGEIETCTGILLDEIQHVGSTSMDVPGMIAKPILDIAARVKDWPRIQQCIPLLAGIGYRYRGEQGIEDRHLFARGDPVIVHLHMMLPGCSNWENQLYFRNYLIEHPEEARAYAALKEGLAGEFKNDRKAYSEAKGAFIERILIRARKVYE